MTSQSVSLFFGISMIIVSSEIFNPYPFILGIERPDANLFLSVSGDIVASRREILVQYYQEGLDAVIKLLSKAAPLTDLYSYLRDHPLQNPAKAKVHCERGFASLRLAVKVYLDVSCYRMSPSNVFVDPYRRNVPIIFEWFRGFFEGHFLSC
jgi:hypothetical protein